MQYRTFRKDGTWGDPISADERDRLIAAGKRTPNQFVTEYEYQLDSGNGGIADRNPIDVLSGIKPADYDADPETKEENRKREVQLLLQKEKFLEIVAPLYKGEIADVVTGVINNQSPGNLSGDQRDLYTLVKMIIKAEDIDAVKSNIESMADDNRYASFLRTNRARMQQYTDKKGTPRQPTASEAIFPNLSDRDNSNMGSKAIGAVHDILTLPTRAITAGIGRLTPSASNVSFSQDLARPIDASTGAENFVDMGMSGILPGMASMKGINAGMRWLRAPETFATAVRGIGQAATRPAAQVIGKGAAKGAIEGAAYSLEPSAAMATTEDNDAPLTTFGMGMGLGALTGGAIGATGAGSRLLSAKNKGQFLTEELTPFGNELATPGNTTRRLQAAIKREPMLAAPDIERNYGQTLSDTRTQISKKIAGERKQALGEIRNKISDADAYNESLRSKRMDPQPTNLSEYRDKLSTMLDKGAKPIRYTTEKLDELMQSPNELDRIASVRGEIDANKLDLQDAIQQGDDARIAEILGRDDLTARTLYGDELVDAFDQTNLPTTSTQLTKSDLDQLTYDPSTTIFTRNFDEPAFDQVSGHYPADIQPLIAGEWDRIVNNVDSSPLLAEGVGSEIERVAGLADRTTDPTRKAMYQGLVKRLEKVESDISDSYLRTLSLSRNQPPVGLTKVRADKANLEQSIATLPAPDQIIQAARSRMKPGTSSEFSRLMESENNINALRQQYGLPPVDILSAPTAAVVRGLRAPSEITAPMLMDGINAASYGLPGVAGRATKAAIAGTAKGVGRGGAVSAMAADDMETEWPIRGEPIEMLTAEGSKRMLLPPVTKQWKNVNDIQ